MPVRRRSADLSSSIMRAYLPAVLPVKNWIRLLGASQKISLTKSPNPSAAPADWGGAGCVAAIWVGAGWVVAGWVDAACLGMPSPARRRASSALRRLNSSWVSTSTWGLGLGLNGLRSAIAVAICAQPE